MAIVLAIDPGNEESAYVLWDGKEILEKGKVFNEELRNIVYMTNNKVEHFAIEMVASYGMPVGKTVFETVLWAGRFIEAWFGGPYIGKFHLIYRKDVKLHHCYSMKANDSTIRQALIDRFEPDLQPKQRPKGLLKGVSKDIWSALAIAVLFSDTHKELFNEN